MQPSFKLGQNPGRSAQHRKSCGDWDKGLENKNEMEGGREGPSFKLGQNPGMEMNLKLVRAGNNDINFKLSY